MREFVELARWGQRAQPHLTERIKSLPTPIFKANGAERVAFSTNNYLSLATRVRLVHSARRDLDLYGVVNCESLR